jgi:uncharacterized protein YqeY
MDKRTEFTDSLKEAMKSRDEVRTGTIRLILAALKEKDIDSRGSGKAEKIGEPEILSMLQSMIKQRNESMETYRKAGREDLAGREEAEIAIIKGFLPQQMNDNEVTEAVEGLVKELNASDIKDMGKVMAALKTRYAGQMDMAKAGGVVRQKLAG